MAILEGWRWLSSSRFKMIIETLASQLEVRAPLLFLQRIPSVNATDDEIVGRFTGRIYAADVIADGQRAVTYEAGKLELQTTALANLKLGQQLDQPTLNRLARMRAGALLPTDNNAMDAWMNRLAANLILGVRMRQNALLCAMQCDLGFNYNRLGISLQGATWGMPAVLKPTVGIAWSLDGTTPNVNATPITDILVLANEVTPDTYGIRFNRVTLSSKAFRFILGTTEFANKAKTILGFDFAAGASPINVHDLPTMQRSLGILLNMEIEVYDGTYQEKWPDGTETKNRVLPANKVLLTNTEYDNDPNVWDWANAPVTESMIAAFVGGQHVPENLAGEQYGPLGYFTVQDPAMNPPGLMAWAVARGWPRRHVNEASACLTVGTFS
jgi:hypothetical protein